MLPDLPKLKSDLQEVLDDHLRTRAHAKLGVFNQVSQTLVHEGDRMRTSRADGSVEETEFREASAEVSIKRSEVPTLTAEARLGMIEKLADDMAAAVSKGLFETLHTSLDAAGQTVSARGKALSHEVFFEVLEKLHVEFDAQGQPSGLQLVVGPQMAPTIQRPEEEFQSDPELRRRHADLMERKRREWRDREAARKLVG